MARKKPETVNGLRGPRLLLDWRARTKTSRQSLAEQMGLKDSASVWQYECGRFPFTYPNLVKLQAITGISVWDLAWPGQEIVMRTIAQTPVPEQR